MGNDSLTTNRIIAKLEEAGGSDSIVAFEGYVSSKGGMVRIYPDFTLTNYVQIRKADIIHVFDMPGDHSDRKRLFVAASTKVNAITVESATADVVYLQTLPFPMQPRFGIIGEHIGFCLRLGRQAGNLRGWIAWAKEHNEGGKLDWLISALESELSNVLSEARAQGCGGVVAV